MTIRRTIRCTALPVAVVAAVFGVAAADESYQLGEKGQYLIGTDLALDYEREVTTYYDDAGNSTDTVQTELQVQLAFDRVMGARFTAGGFLGFDTEVVDDSSRSRSANTPTCSTTAAS